MTDSLFRLSQTFTEHKDNVTCVSFSANGTYLATGSSDRTLHIYQFASQSIQLTKKLTITLPNNMKGGINTITWSEKTCNNGNYLLVGTDDGILSIYDVESPQASLPVTEKMGEQAHSSPCLCTAWKDGLIASGSFNGEIILYQADNNNVRAWNVKWRKEAHSDPVTGVGFADLSKEKKVLVTVGIDGFMFFWDLDTSRAARPMVYFPSEQSGIPVPIGGLQVASQARFVVVSTMDGSLRLWDVQASKVIRTFPNTGNTSRLIAPTICAHEKKGHQYVIMGCESGQILAWTVSDPKDTAEKAICADGRDNHRAPVFCVNSITRTEEANGAKWRKTVLVSGSLGPSPAVKVWEYVGPGAK